MTLIRQARETDGTAENPLAPAVRRTMNNGDGRARGNCCYTTDVVMVSLPLYAFLKVSLVFYQSYIKLGLSDSRDQVGDLGSYLYIEGISPTWKYPRILS